MACNDAGNDVSEVSVRVDAVELRGFYERSDGRPVPATTVGTGEERIFRLRAIGLIERSTTLESISTRPSSMNRSSPAQRDSG